MDKEIKSPERVIGEMDFKSREHLALENFLESKNIMIKRNFDRSIGLGFDMYFHKHMKGTAIHFHVCITFVAWFIELQIGKEV